MIILFHVIKHDYFPRKSDDRVHYDFNILRYPYLLQKSKTDLTRYQDNSDILFKEIENKGQTPIKLTAFERFQKFIFKEMKLQTNYQPIMIRTLLESKGYRSTKEFISKIQELN